MDKHPYPEPPNLHKFVCSSAQWADPHQGPAASKTLPASGTAADAGESDMVTLTAARSSTVVVGLRALFLLPLISGMGAGKDLPCNALIRLCFLLGADDPGDISNRKDYFFRTALEICFRAQSDARSD
jgi:hypothetical protein